MMTPTFIGYFAKRIVKRDREGSCAAVGGFPVGPPVDEICSVSGCIAKAPEGWRDHEKHNAFGVYDSPDLAWSVVPADLRGDFDLFAYHLFPVQYEEGREENLEALEWWDLAVEPMSPLFVRLGWDVVVGGSHSSFGCSPLSCNGQAGLAGIPAVNRYCLLSSEQEGLHLAREFSTSKPEPGPYCVVEVWRKGKDSA
jgi:hypothetical protein